MSNDKEHEHIVVIPENPQEEIVCPFSQGKWKKVSDALVFFMLFVTPILWIIAIVITKLF
ncbi:MAG: hypothetical protein ACFFFK_10355 [Candidatus Thorarchaeota archaeon]